MKFPEILTKILRFSVTGFVGMLVDFTFTTVGKEIMHLNSYIANCLGVSIAMAVIFVLHLKWTFRNAEKDIKRQIKQFLGVSIFGMILNTGLLHLFWHYLPMSFYLAKALSVALVAIWNFSFNSLFTFKPELNVSKS